MDTAGGVDQASVMPQGQVFLFDKHDMDTQPLFSIKTSPAPDLKTILDHLSGKYSPIQSECQTVCKLSN